MSHMTLADVDLLVAIRIGVMILWGVAGLVAMWQVKAAHEWGLAWLAFGAYLAMGWLAVKP
jgi:hypothetical protein